MTNTPGWIRKFHRAKAEAAAPLLIFPHAGGGASIYRPFSKQLSADFDVILFQYPGRQDRAAEAALTTLPDIAAGAFAEFVRSPFNRDQPITVFGHSLGALVAFEFTRLAEAAGVPVRLLGVSGAVAPWKVEELPPHPTEDEELLDHLAGLNGTGADVMGNRELMRMTLPVLKADYRAFDAYSCPVEVTLNVDIHAMGGGDDDFVTIGDLHAWQRHTTQDLEVSVFDGGHFYIHDNVDGIVEVLTAELVSPQAGR
ncbi:thioesterase II family protein [Nocardia brasiliensis]|uniref:thioesterase II family protein n=1 Tax=Nocardia brasiliensis TaxID=37326 RepID=UPI001893292B|nr:alpha/beta fold hydrolase [Nocardia brasiliensis]MBF6125125.1 thioesterase [Nocardia brasiliensis]